MPLAALEQGVPWNWETFGEYLDRLDGNVGVNAGFLVGPLRAAPLRDGRRRRSATRPRPSRSTRWSQVLARVDRGRRPRLLDHAVAAPTPTATASRSPSRWATHGRGARAVRARSASTRAPRSRASSTAASTASATTRSSCSPTCRAAADRPLNWNVLTVDSQRPDRVAAPARGAATRAAEAGGRVVALTMPVLVPHEHELPHLLRAATCCPDWGDDPRPAGARAHREAAGPRDPRACSRTAPHSRGRRRVRAASPTSAATSSATPTPTANEGLQGPRRRRHRRRAGPGPVRHAPRHRRRRRPAHRAVADPDRRRRRVVGAAPPSCGTTPGVMLGGSDAGAHLDRMCGAPYTTRFLGDCIRGRKLVAARAGRAADHRGPGRAVRPARPGPPRRGRPRRRRRVRPRDRRRRARHPRPRPARRHAPPHRRRHRRRARLRQRRRDRRRRRGHRRPPRHRAALRRDTDTVSTHL